MRSRSDTVILLHLHSVSLALHPVTFICPEHGKSIRVAGGE